MFLLTSLTIGCNTASDSELSTTTSALQAALDEAIAANEALAVRVEQLESQNLGARIDAVQADVFSLENAQESTNGSLVALTEDVALLDSREFKASQDATIRMDETAAAVSAIDTWISNVDPLFDYLTVDTITNSVVFEGANVFVQSGSGSTDGTVNGLGNLIVGYNEFTGIRSTDQAGSHNLVVGSDNGFTSYGGIVSGESNRTAAPYSSVVGGYSNAAIGSFSMVLGGSDASATGKYAATVAGILNDASGDYSVVLGGASNEATGDYTSVSGGESNTASGSRSSILGGYRNTASGSYTTVYGGQSQTASTSYAYKP